MNVAQRSTWLRALHLACVSVALNAVAASAAVATGAADAPVEVHGHSDAFSAHGIAIAWSVLRGPSEQASKVVLKVVVDGVRYKMVAVDGVDPFTRQRQSITPRVKLNAAFEVRVLQSHYADFPRTELRFYADDKEAEPRVVVYYVGVPDTTPEFADEAKLESFLAERVRQLAERKDVP